MTGRRMTGSIPEPDLPEGLRLDPAVEQVGAQYGYWWVIHKDGSRTAWQEKMTLICPVCNNDPEKVPDCAHCVGRGFVDHIPFAKRPWDEVFPGLWLGGHDCQPSDARPNGECRLADTWETDWFDVVISLFQPKQFDLQALRWAPDHSFEPPTLTPAGKPVEHYYHRMADAELDPENHNVIDELGRIAYEALVDGQKVLIRCQAGLNRSSLIAALTMMRIGSSADRAIEHFRSVRSPYVLCNQSFVDYLHQKESTTVIDAATNQCLCGLESIHTPEECPLRGTFAQMTKDVFDTNTANGWFDEDRVFGDDMALIHSEISEMFEAFRDHGLEDATSTETQPQREDGTLVLPKPEGVGSEAADILVRILDTCHRFNVRPKWKALADIPPHPGFNSESTFGTHITSLHLLVAYMSKDALNLGPLIGYLVAFCAEHGVDLQAEFDRKLAYNKTRGYRHGGKRI